MTRINLVPVKELADQHLMAEYREMPMVPAALRRSMRTKSDKEILKSVPGSFTLNAGHVRFFYNKMQYLCRRYSQLQGELIARGYKIDLSRTLNDYGIPDEFYDDYDPTEDAVKIIRQRIAEKIAMKPAWYKYYGESIYE
jgi:deoxyribonuclease (pyrimidine dimer)